MQAAEFITRLKKVSPTAGGWTACCPSHEDGAPSLSITQESDRVLVHCHAGCTADSVCAALGITTADLFSTNGKKQVNPKSGSPAKREVATYDYQDADGTLLYQVVRYFPKTFRQRRLNAGVWVWNMEGVKRVLFRLPELIAAIKEQRPVFLVEGEKDVLAMAGFAATCNAGGAGKWEDSYSETLRGADVVIVADKDEPGRKHAAAVAGKLQGIAGRVRVIELPDVNGKPVKDAHDFLSIGGKPSDLAAIAAAAPTWTATTPAVIASDDVDSSKTEFEFANLLMESLPPIRCCAHDWFVYSSGLWRETDRHLYRPDAQRILPPAIRTARRESTLLEHIEGRSQVAGDSFSGFYRFDDSGNVLLNVANGIVRVTPDDVSILPHSQEHLFTRRIAASYAPGVKADLFERILLESLPDEHDRVLLQLTAGNFLLPDCRFEVALICYGEAGRGKSTCAEPIALSLGADVVPRLTMAQLCDPRSYHLPKLKFGAVNLGTELDAVELGESGIFKAVVSGEAVEARPIYGKPFTMATTCKLWFLANSLPRFRHGTDAELRRVRFLRFDQLPERKDVTLKSRLSLERDAVFGWMLNGLREILSLPELPHGSRESRLTRDRFRISNDPVGSFVEQRCVFDRDASITKETLAESFREFCLQFDIPAGVSGWFFRSLYERWPQIRESRTTNVSGDRERRIVGIQLKSL